MLRTRPRGAFPPAIIVVGASTGGPQALVALISALAPALPFVPVCVTLHMPPDLMPVIASHVERVCGVPTGVMTEPRVLTSGHVHFAPGDKHMAFHRQETGVEVFLNGSAPGDYCKPAVDVMFTSAAASHGSRTLGIVLSGMGKDGLVGANAIVAAGGSVIVQDRASSAVWGMPGSVAKAGLASAVLEPRALGREVIRRLQAHGYGDAARRA